ncbi:MAG: DUF4860 domain-containing protein [Pseudoflavonifractor sp.]
MKFPTVGRMLRSMVVVLLAALFFLLAMGVALLGSQVYRSAVQDSDENYIHRSALSYVVNQVRRGDAGGVTVADFGGCSAVRLTEVLPDGSVYATVIYCYDGQLRELYAGENTALAPEDGIAILPLERLDFSVDGPRLMIAATDAAGHSLNVIISPRTGVREVGTL